MELSILLKIISMEVRNLQAGQILRRLGHKCYCTLSKASLYMLQLGVKMEDL